MRTIYKFQNVFDSAKRFVKFHNKSVWIVATKDDYALSCFKPSADTVPFGTNAVTMDIDGVIGRQTVSGTMNKPSWM